MITTGAPSGAGTAESETARAETSDAGLGALSAGVVNRFPFPCRAGVAPNLMGGRRARFGSPPRSADSGRSTGGPSFGWRTLVDRTGSTGGHGTDRFKKANKA